MRYYKGEDVSVGDLVGKTILSIDRITADEWSGPNQLVALIFHMADGSEYQMYHEQDCCESVWLEDLTGDLDDLMGSPILLAEETGSDDGPLGSPEWTESFTWTFYNFATLKGYVTLRWYGESNGYYSEEVDFVKTRNPGGVKVSE